MDGWMGGKAGLRIAYSNKNFIKNNNWRITIALTTNIYLMI